MCATRNPYATREAAFGDPSSRLSGPRDDGGRRLASAPAEHHAFRLTSHRQLSVRPIEGRAGLVLTRGMGAPGSAGKVHERTRKGANCAVTVRHLMCAWRPGRSGRQQAVFFLDKAKVVW
jgi:hypothetical protein